MSDGNKSPIDVLGENVAELHNVQIERLNKLQNDLFHVARLQYDSAMQAISEMKVYFTEEMTQKASISSLNEIVNQRSLQVASLSKELDDHRSNTKRLIEGVQEAVIKLKSSYVEASSYADDYSVLMTKINELKEQASCNRDESSRNVSNALEYIDKKIEDLRIEFASKPSELNEFREDLQKKVEALAVESRNADEISKKTSQKHYLLDKKIESAVYLLQKHGLQV